MKKIFFTLLILTATFNIFAENDGDLSQTVRGTVVDKQTKWPLIGATVFILNQKPTIGATTDMNGEFALENVPLGRQSIQITYVGYEPMLINNLQVTSGKELVLNLELEEKVYSAKEVVITAKNDKSGAINKMATVSTRSFSIEETNKYAGSLGDPARMAANFAGVATVSDSRNDIIIRGNSPMGLLWRLDGIEIPNPNHFGALGTTGGPVSMLNNNLLTNSDFFTGAFPAEYSNANAGAFDLRMRNGNNQKREYIGQIGFNGFELGAEGPFSKNSRASYLVNYRYSAPALFDELNFSSSQGSSIPYYQDLSFKINVPGIKYGSLSLFGIMGKSYIKLYDTEKDSTEFSYGLNGTNTLFGSETAVSGLKHLYFFNETTSIKTILSFSYLRSYTDIDSISKTNQDSLYPWLRSDLKEYKYSISTHLNKKLNSKNNLTFGVYYDLFQVDLLDTLWEYDYQSFIKASDVEADLSLVRAYGQWQHKFTEVFSLYTGLNFMYLALNDHNVVEPRLGLKYQLAERHTLSMGAGLHSQMQPKQTYFAKTRLDDGSYIETNNNLDFTKSRHLVLGYDWQISNNFRLKAETYYQSLYDVPVSPNEDYFSMLNEGSYFAITNIDSLENKGKGENYGVELTLEKFLSNGYYFLFTASVFDSKYTGYDGKWRNTAFNTNYVFNILAGYEYEINEKMILTANIKTVWSGGKRYTPINELRSIADEETVYYNNRTFELKHDDYFKTDLRFSFKMNGKRITQEWAIDLKNITNRQNVFMQSYDPKEGEIHTDYQEGFLPMFLYRIHF
jgi:hypothetical protein